MSETIELISKNETLLASITGAVIASAIGIIASVYLEWRRNNREQNKYRKLIKLEISDIMHQINILERDEQRISKIGKLVISNSWIMGKDYLHDKLSAEEINAVDKLFNIANEYDRLQSTMSEANLIEANAFDWNYDHLKRLLFDKNAKHVYNTIDKVIDKL